MADTSHGDGQPTAIEVHATCDVAKPVLVFKKVNTDLLFILSAVNILLGFLSSIFMTAIIVPFGGGFMFSGYNSQDYASHGYFAALFFMSCGFFGFSASYAPKQTTLVACLACSLASIIGGFVSFYQCILASAEVFWNPPCNMNFPDLHIFGEDAASCTVWFRLEILLAVLSILTAYMNVVITIILIMAFHKEPTSDLHRLWLYLYGRLPNIPDWLQLNRVDTNATNSTAVVSTQQTLVTQSTVSNEQASSSAQTHGPMPLLHSKMQSFNSHSVTSTSEHTSFVATRQAHFVSSQQHVQLSVVHPQPNLEIAAVGGPELNQHAVAPILLVTVPTAAVYPDMAPISTTRFPILASNRFKQSNRPVEMTSRLEKRPKRT